MTKYHLTEEEREIEADIENMQPVSEEKKARIERIIDRAKKNRAISLRINNHDLEKLKEKAREEGIPYQTLINMILHKYVTNRLLDKEELLKTINILREKEVI